MPSTRRVDRWHNPTATPSGSGIPAPPHDHHHSGHSHRLHLRLCTLSHPPKHGEFAFACNTPNDGDRLCDGYIFHRGGECFDVHSEHRPDNIRRATQYESTAHGDFRAEETHFPLWETQRYSEPSSQNDSWSPPDSSRSLDWSASVKSRRKQSFSRRVASRSNTRYFTHNRM